MRLFSFTIVPTISVAVNVELPKPICTNTVTGKVCSEIVDHNRVDEIRWNNEHCELSVELRSLTYFPPTYAVGVAMMRALEKMPSSVISNVNCAALERPKKTLDGSVWDGDMKQYICRIDYTTNLGTLKPKLIGDHPEKKVQRTCGALRSLGWRIVWAFSGSPLATWDSERMDLVTPLSNADKCEVLLPKDSSEKTMTGCLTVMDASNPHMTPLVHADGDLLAIVCIDEERMEWIGTYRVHRDFVRKNLGVHRLSNSLFQTFLTGQQLVDKKKYPIKVPESAARRACTALNTWISG